jgi:hypothetical protein
MQGSQAPKCLRQCIKPSQPACYIHIDFVYSIPVVKQVSLQVTGTFTLYAGIRTICLRLDTHSKASQPACILHYTHASYTSIIYTHHLFSSVDSQLLIHSRLKVVLNNAAAIDDDRFCKGNTYSETVMLTLQVLHTAVLHAACMAPCRYVFLPRASSNSFGLLFCITVFAPDSYSLKLIYC